MGDLSYRIKETTDYGNFVELQAILVKDLVEYQSKSGGVTDDFAVLNWKEAPATESVAVKQGVPDTEPEEDDSSELPF